MPTAMEVHGDGACHICGKPKAGPGRDICSYPHGMVPDEEVSAGMWTWKMPAASCKRCGGWKWLKLEDPCFRCQGSGVDPDAPHPSPAGQASPDLP